MLEPNTITQTRTGAPVIIYTDLAKGDRPIHGAYYTGEDWMVAAWGRDGRLFPDKWTALDIIIPDGQKTA